MKRFLTLTILMTMAVTVYSQRYIVSTNFERTSISPKTGLSFGITLGDSIEIGVFYQQSDLIETLTKGDNENTADLPRFYEKHFYGISASYPLWSHKIFRLNMNIRTGLVNHESFIITPSIRSDIKITKNISFEVGMGTRCFRPTLLSSLKVRL